MGSSSDRRKARRAAHRQAATRDQASAPSRLGRPALVGTSRRATRASIFTAIGWIAAGFFVEHYIPLGSGIWLLAALIAFAIAFYPHWKQRYSSLSRRQQVGFACIVLVAGVLLVQLLPGARNRYDESGSAKGSAISPEMIPVPQAEPESPLDSGSAIERFRSAERFLARQEIEILKEPGFRFEISGMEFIVRGYTRDPRNPLLTIRLVAEEIPTERGVTIRMEEGTAFAFDVALKKGCETELTTANRSFTFVILDDTHTRTLAGILAREGDFERFNVARRCG